MDKPLVLKTVYIDAEIDNELTREAFDTKTSKAELFRRYLKLGMQISKARAERGGEGSNTYVVVNGIKFYDTDDIQ